MTDINYVISWSGGKDSCLACYEALRRGYTVSYLVNFISTEPQRVRFHGTDVKLIQMQSQAIGISLIQKETTWNGYEQDFKVAIADLIPRGVKGMIFGDIYVQEHLDWVERVCADLGIIAVEPLWGQNPENILSSFIDSGFEAVVVSAKSDLIDKDWIGRKADRSFMQYLSKRGIDFCGENGEYHTLVTGGPIFKQRMQLLDSRTINKDGYWLLDTVKYQFE